MLDFYKILLVLLLKL